MKIRSVSRLHFGLIDMNGSLGRVDGGIGLTLSEPYFELRVKKADSIQVTGPEKDRVERAALAILDKIGEAGVSINISDSFPSHVGLGSGTQIALAAGLGTLRIYGKDWKIREIADSTGRGGTSGIGTAAFDSGGFILDGGHDLSEKSGFIPSRNATASPPPVLSRVEFPEWEIAVLIPEGRGAYGDSERSLFNAECPIPNREVEAVARIVTMSLLPSVVNQRFDEFREAVYRLQNVGFKEREIQSQPKSREIVEDLHERGYAAGMSSIGPAVYAIHPANVDVSDFAITSISTEARNRGAEIIQ